MEKVSYKGWKNCYRLSNKIIELIVTADIGPRIIRFGFVGQQNEFKEYSEMLGKTGGNDWRIYGGHRLWHAPEAVPRTYYPDNSAVYVEKHSEFASFRQCVEMTTGIEKTIDIYLSKNQSYVKVVHRLKNKNSWSVELAPWAMSVMAPGGKMIIPLPARGVHPRDLLPTSTLTIWPYTDLKDARWTWGSKYILLKQDSKIPKKPQKIGALVSSGWAGYLNSEHLFIKKTDFIDGAIYPDFGSNFEFFTNEDMLEFETLGPLAALQPEKEVEHIEHWLLFSGIKEPHKDMDVDKYIVPKVRIKNSK